MEVINSSFKLNFNYPKRYKPRNFITFHSRDQFSKSKPLQGDAVVRRNLKKLLKTDEMLTEKASTKWFAQFSPWRALVVAHLWVLETELGY